MTSSEKEKLGKQLHAKGFQNSSSDSNLWKRGNDRIKFDSPNGYNNDGDKLRGYNNCRDRISKK